MEEVLTKLSAWAAPPLLGAVIWFLVKKFEDLDKTIENSKAHSASQNRSLEDKVEKSLERVSTDLRDLQGELTRTQHSISNVQMTMNKEIQTIEKTVIEMKSTTNEVKRWLEDSRIHHGKIIHLDASVQRHEQILISSAKVMKNQNDRITRTEGEVINLIRKKKKDEDEGA